MGTGTSRTRTNAVSAGAASSAATPPHSHPGPDHDAAEPERREGDDRPTSTPQLAPRNAASSLTRKLRSTQAHDTAPVSATIPSPTSTCTHQDTGAPHAHVERCTETTSPHATASGPGEAEHGDARARAVLGVGERRPVAEEHEERQHEQDVGDQAGQLADEHPGAERGQHERRRARRHHERAPRAHPFDLGSLSVMPRACAGRSAQVQSQVERGDGVGERADGEVVDPGLGVGAGVLQRRPPEDSRPVRALPRRRTASRGVGHA